MKKLLVMAAWTVGALLLTHMAMDTVYGATSSSKSRTTTTTDWSNVTPPPTNPDYRTQYVP